MRAAGKEATREAQNRGRGYRGVVGLASSGPGEARASFMSIFAQDLDPYLRPGSVASRFWTVFPCAYGEPESPARNFILRPEAADHGRSKTRNQRWDRLFAGAQLFGGKRSLPGATKRPQRFKRGILSARHFQHYDVLVQSLPINLETGPANEFTRRDLRNKREERRIRQYTVQCSRTSLTVG